MEEPRFYQRPSFYILSRLLLVVIFYVYGTYKEWKAGELGPLQVYFDALVFIVLLVVWLAFFAQFILPVQTFQERRKIFDRLVAYLSGLRGPAIFVKNGQPVTRSGESKRSGPGVLWLDSASGAVTHVNVSFKNTLGPGVHFTDWGEKIGETVDLHTQFQRIGPRESDRPFEAFDPHGEMAYELYSELQKRRTMVSALSRDGIEVLPNISVVFKIDADPVKGDQPGSHFGFSKQAVQDAVIGEAINPNAQPNTLEYKVAWNELPAAIAADLWREYMSKFTLSQLFAAELIPLAPVPRPNEQPANPDAAAMHAPVASRSQTFFADFLTGMLHELNNGFGRWADHLESQHARPPSAPPRTWGSIKPPAPSRQTALQVINFMIKERLTNPFVPQLDANGERIAGWQESREYLALKKRGIRVINASVSNLRFQPSVEEQIVGNWTSNWLLNARSERERIETARSFASLGGQEKALINYAQEISEDLLEKKKEGASVKEAVMALLVRSRTILVRSDRMHRRASHELQELEEVMQWLEGDPT